MSTSRMQKYLTDCRTLPGDISGAWRAGGMSGVWLELRRRTVDRVGGYARGLVVEADITDVPEVAPPPGIEITPFAGPDWSLLGDLAGERLRAKFAAAAAAGRSCMIARRGRQVVGYAWISPAVTPLYESFELPLPADAIYAWHVQVARQERGRGIGSALVGFRLHHARLRGFRRAWGVIRPDNIASLRSFSSAGPCQVVGTVFRVKVLSSMRSRFRPLVQPYSVRGQPCASR